MNELKAAISRGRVKMLIESQNRRYRPPKSDIVTINADGIGLRISTDFLELFDSTAQCRLLNYCAVESERTIDSVLISECDNECEYVPILNTGDEVYV